jgi:hypothetical protein
VNDAPDDPSIAAPPVAPPPAAPARRLSRLIVACTVGLTACAAAVQLLATFFYDAPSNVVSQRYHTQLVWWMNPLLNQNWQLFAPNPISENVEVDARASVGASGAITSWVDLSAIDYASNLDNPVPGHLAMNALRNAWLEYSDTHDASGGPDSPMADTAQAYLANLVLGYLRPRESQQIDSVQVRFVVTLVPGDGRTPAQTAPQTQQLSWIAVAGGVG